jgi:hypothetical protein
MQTQISQSFRNGYWDGETKATNCDKDIGSAASVYLDKLWNVLLGACMLVRAWGYFVNTVKFRRDKMRGNTREPSLIVSEGVVTYPSRTRSADHVQLLLINYDRAELP